MKIASTIPELEAKRARLISEAEQILRQAGSSNAEMEAAVAQARALGESVDRLDDELRRLEADQRRARYSRAIEPHIPARHSTVSVRSEPTTYGPGSEWSYFLDVVRAARDHDLDAAERLRRHAEEVRHGAVERVAQGKAEYRDLTRTDGAGGQFVPPLWLVDQFVALARAGRPTADILDRRPLPTGTDSLNIPAVSTGTATAIQTADNAAVQETDLADTAISAPVRTIAGQQDVAVQLLEQSPVGFDDVVFADLIGDYNTKLDVQVLSGSGSSGQITGLRTVSGINAVTYTDATPTVPEIYAKLADAINQVASNVFAPPTHIVMHPRRWAWFLTALDTQNRPLVVPDAGVNAMGSADGVGEGRVGRLMGLPVVTDASIPTNLGAGTNEDVILVLRATETLLFESTVRTRVLPEVGSGTLTTRLQVYGYVAMATRRPKSISTIGGTGLVAPTF